ncbi:MAG: Nramp family divalent metal transporter [Gammaproteobacteria bacterium]|nr:Nramp family divalent metal transporter [Gammaproteobacteria bacterium]
MLDRLKEIGPGALVAAAFIGPGTVTVCTLAGADFGYTLLWALVFATVATIVFQEMAGRLGAAAQSGLGQALRQTLGGSAWRWPLYALITVALYAGNAAYEAGNLSGAALGAEAVLGGGVSFEATVVAISLLAAVALVRGTYRQLERLLIGLVALMGIAFVGTFAVTRPDVVGMLEGLFVPRIPDGGLVMVLALIGTTVVPYNLFLHASAAKARWAGAGDLAAARTDTILSVGVGGLVSIFIVSTASASLFAQGLAARNAADMAVQLEPLFGPIAKYLLGIGLLAAGFSSALTAPLATAFAVTELTGADGSRSLRVFRGIALSVLSIGCIFALSGIQPITIILSAQFANGLLLPIIAAFLLYTMNDRNLLGDHVNGRAANVLGGLVFVISLGLGARLILGAFGIL